MEREELVSALRTYMGPHASMNSPDLLQLFILNEISESLKTLARQGAK